VFYVGLPAAIVTRMAGADLRAMNSAQAALLFCGVTLGLFGLAALVGRIAIRPGSRGAFVQGAYRGNLVIVGLPIIARALGDDAFLAALVVLAFAMPLYNILAVIALTAGTHSSGIWPTVRRVIGNPLIVALAAGILLSLTGIQLPEFVARTGSYLGQMTFPLALLGIGAGMNRATLGAGLGATLAATAIKLALTPLAVGLCAVQAGLPGRMVSILTILAATPTAVASFIMARAMDADDRLAGAVVFVTTAGSVVSMSAAILVLRMSGLL
jgi:predicted permease